MLSCKNSGYELPDHFAEVSKTIKMSENLPVPDNNISAVEREQLKKLKKSPKKLMLDE